MPETDPGPLPIPKIAVHGWRGKICQTHPTIMKLGIPVTYLKKNRKIYRSYDTPLEFC